MKIGMKGCCPKSDLSGMAPISPDASSLPGWPLETLSSGLHSPKLRILSQAEKPKNLSRDDVTS